MSFFCPKDGPHRRIGTQEESIKYFQLTEKSTSEGNKIRVKQLLPVDEYHNVPYSNANHSCHFGNPEDFDLPGNCINASSHT